MSNDEPDPGAYTTPHTEDGDDRAGAHAAAKDLGNEYPEVPHGSAEDGDGSDAGMSSKDREKKEDKGSFWKELPILVIVAVVIAFAIKTWVVQPFYIPSKSMEDTLLVGDRILVNKLVYEIRDIERGDVVVFNGSDSWDEDTEVEEPEPANPVAGVFTWMGQTLGLAPTGKEYVKRVIALEGDTVECCDDDNNVLVNGDPVDEPYLYPGSVETHQEFGPITVEEGRLWVMGDHRAISYDSRTHQGDPGGGTISEESVVGRAFVTVWPLNRLGTL